MKEKELDDTFYRLELICENVNFTDDDFNYLKKYINLFLNYDSKFNYYHYIKDNNSFLELLFKKSLYKKNYIICDYIVSLGYKITSLNTEMIYLIEHGNKDYLNDLIRYGVIVSEEIIYFLSEFNSKYNGLFKCNEITDTITKYYNIQCRNLKIKKIMKRIR